MHRQLIVRSRIPTLLLVVLMAAGCGGGAAATADSTPADVVDAFGAAGLEAADTDADPAGDTAARDAGCEVARFGLPAYDPAAEGHVFKCPPERVREFQALIGHYDKLEQQGTPVPYRVVVDRDLVLQLPRELPSARVDQYADVLQQVD